MIHVIIVLTGGMGVSERDKRNSLNDILLKSNQILEECNQYVVTRIEKEEVKKLPGINQVEKIFDFQADFFSVHYREYVLLKGYEDRMFFETENEEYYQKHLVCLQNCRKSLTDAIATGIEDGTIRKGLELRQEAALLEGAFGSVLRSECEKIDTESGDTQKDMKRMLKKCVQMSMLYLKNE